MSYLDTIADRIRTGQPLPLPLAAALTVGTLVPRAGMALRRMRAPVRVNARVISFGNITAGGTGKTPAVIERVLQEIQTGHRVAVLTRGYGAAPARDTIAMIGAEAAGHGTHIGDEPALIGKHAPDAWIVRDADRFRGARAAIERHQCDTLILDDGFQWLRLARDEDVVLIDATSPFGNGRLLPRGILREPLQALRRATALVVTRCDQADTVESLRTKLQELAPGVPVRLTQHAPVGLWNLATGEHQPVEALRGRGVTAVCAIGRPEGFWKTLEGLGARIVDCHGLRDHAHIEPAAVRGEFVVTTEKDAIRMGAAPDTWWALQIALRDWP